MTHHTTQLRIHRAQARSDPDAPSAAGKDTMLHLALGSAAEFSLNWRQKRAAGESDALLAADHRLALLPRRDNPTFVWESAVTIRRQKTGLLEFREGAGTQVVRLDGAQVHSWERDGDYLRVLLAEPGRLEAAPEPH